ncbi:MAG: thiol-disulfide oxidoreductase DCC family protein [Verrucomicrobia bacterium]|nr:thiol-disulfide oxidoreductase DCC family protein [Verrucomicrobiota bacterium]
MTSGPIILFDGDCALCDRAVRFVVTHDPARRFHFAPLRSEIAARLLASHGLAPDTIRSVVLLHAGQIRVKSDAALGIVARLPAPWRWLGAFRVVPRPLRDWVYDWIARHRHRWFGRAPTCPTPSPELASRLLR